MKIPRIILGGTSSRAGKTVLSIGLMRALKNRGYDVQPFKVGPDFIDPSFHLFATQRHSRNLDSFMLRRENVMEAFQRNSKSAEIAIIEGTMGLYDSHDAVQEQGSTAEVSKILKAPVILIANVERISRTAAALVLGYKFFDPKVKISGVILNRAGSERHAEKVRLAVERLAKMKVVGVIPRDEGIKIPERHLGLVPAYEREQIDALFHRLAEVVEEYVDVDAIVRIAKAAPALPDVEENAVFHPRRNFDISLGVIRDKAFSFYYQDNLDAFEANGARIKYVNALEDASLPSVDALYIGGGFPEVFAQELEQNSSLRSEIKEFCEAGKPVYAECGGLMYLGKSIVTKEGKEYEMAGVLPIKTKMESRFQALGYAKRKVVVENAIAKNGAALVGHEFHYSKAEPVGKIKYAYKVSRGRGVNGTHDGILYKNTLASYLHLHVLSYPGMVKNFLGTAEKLR